MLFIYKNKLIYLTHLFKTYFYYQKVKKYVEKSAEKSCTKEKCGAVSHQNCC